MRKKKFPSILLAALLAFSILPVFPPAWAVWTGGTIYIKADGSIVPSNAPVTTRDKVTYTLTDDIKTTGNGIVVERDNIILDGNGHTITGPGSARGILLEYRKNVTIRNFKIENFNTGIYLYYSSGNTITGNTITNNEYGIHLFDSDDNEIIGNVFSGCGLLITNSFFNVVEGNTVNGKPLVYLENASDVVVKDAGQVILVRCKRVIVENLNLSNTTVGVQLWQTKDSTIKNNTITNNYYGIRLFDSSGNTIIGNTISNKWYGIYLWVSSYNGIVGNVFSGCGLFVYDSFFNVVEGNTVNGKPLVYLENASDVVVSDVGQVILVRCKRVIVENLNLSNTTVGVQLLESRECIIKNNTITNNEYGIHLFDSDDNEIIGNVFSGCGLLITNSFF
ncbi:MAG: NosD domain-containing protein, partial [Thermofilaceae archaeon]